jgi:GMP synthase-like glutamine amidotransferase
MTPRRPHALVLQHLPVEHPGSVGRRLSDAHPWLTAERQAIRRWVRGRERTFFGLWLGHQLLADVVGGRVGPIDPPEVGTAELEATVAGRSTSLEAVSAILTTGLLARMCPVPDTAVAGTER